MKVIGGYLELELRHGEHYHKNAIRLNSARNCFEYILLARKYKKVYIPFYTCDVLLQPLWKYKIAYEFYSINKFLEPTKTIKLLKNEALLYTNYFGLKQKCVEDLASSYGTQLIIDNAQAFFAPRIESIDTFYSPRKFLGVPDGGYLYTNYLLNDNFQIDKSYHRIKHLIYRIEKGAEEGYAAFREADDSLTNQPILKMSELTERILQSIDYEYIKSRRCDNFRFLHNKLGIKNNLSLELSKDSVPMVYPYYTFNVNLKRKLIQEKIFTATYWPNVLKWCSNTDMEFVLCNHIIPIPIDQRYYEKDMERITEIIKKYE